MKLFIHYHYAEISIQHFYMILINFKHKIYHLHCIIFSIKLCSNPKIAHLFWYTQLKVIWSRFWNCWSPNSFHFLDPDFKSILVRLSNYYRGWGIESIQKCYLGLRVFGRDLGQISGSPCSSLFSARPSSLLLDCAYTAHVWAWSLKVEIPTNTQRRK